MTGAGAAGSGRAGGPGRNRRARLAAVATVLVLAGLASTLVVRDYLFQATARRIAAVSFPGGEVVVGVAVTRSEREAGLAGRESLPPDSGLLFVYRDTRPRRFTTEDMRFGLDIITLSHDKVVTGVVTRQPGEPPFVTAPARYVLEVGSGWAAAHGVRAGTKADLIGR